MLAVYRGTIDQNENAESEWRPNSAIYELGCAGANHPLYTGKRIGVQLVIPIDQAVIATSFWPHPWKLAPPRMSIVFWRSQLKQLRENKQRNLCDKRM